MPNGALLVVARARGPVYYAKWRDRRGSQVKRALGPAWVTREGEAWRRRRGRPGAKPSTIADYRYYLAPATARPRTSGRVPAARIMRAFGHRPVASITSVEIARFLARLDAEPSFGPRTVNKHRQVLCSVFRHAMRDDTFSLAVTRPRRRTSAANPTTRRSTSTSPRRCSRSRVRRARDATAIRGGRP